MGYISVLQERTNVHSHRIMCTSFVPYSPSDRILIAMWVEDAKTTMDSLLIHLKNRHPRQYDFFHVTHFECDSNQLLSDVFTFINQKTSNNETKDNNDAVLQNMQMTINQLEQRVLSITHLLQANDTPSKSVKPRARRQRKSSATQNSTSTDPIKAVTMYLNRPFTDPMVPTTKLFNEFKEWCVTNNCTINKDGMTYTEFVSTVKSVCAFYIMVGVTLYVKAPNKMIVKIEV